MEWERVHDICIVGRRRGAGGSRRGGGAYIRHATSPLPRPRPLANYHHCGSIFDRADCTVDCFH